MSKVFRDSDGAECMRWFEDGSGIHMTHIYKSIHTEDIPAFVAWLQEGPPKKRYRITRTFSFRPGSVHGGNCMGAVVVDSDIAEVWE